MGTLEIPREHWLSFFNLFSQQHEGWLSTLEVMGEDVGDQFEAQQYAFNGVSYDPKGTVRDSIDIELGLDAAHRVNHAIARPCRVALMLTEEGAHEGLEIESEDGVKNILRFRRAEYPAQITGQIREEASRKMQNLIDSLARKIRRAGS